MLRWISENKDIIRYRPLLINFRLVVVLVLSGWFVCAAFSLPSSANTEFQAASDSGQVLLVFCGPVL